MNRKTKFSLGIAPPLPRKRYCLYSYSRMLLISKEYFSFVLYRHIVQVKPTLFVIKIKITTTDNSNPATLRDCFANCVETTHMWQAHFDASCWFIANGFPYPMLNAVRQNFFLLDECFTVDQTFGSTFNNVLEMTHSDAYNIAV